ncbi:hypothetical protein MhomT_16250 [Microbacterium hominis]|nr:hypothetical protein MhomT_16250 [Microbacterium hominis]
MGETIVLQARDPRRDELERIGWVVAARSFGAQLDVDRIDEHKLGVLAAAAGISTRELVTADIDAVLKLDRSTIEDYPGSIATQHPPLDPHRASPSSARRGFGAFPPSGELVAMTFLDIEGTHAETDFTVVHAQWRRRGIATAVKAASLLALAGEGFTRFRTGGSADNEAIIRANDALGYLRDEEWVTLERCSV